MDDFYKSLGLSPGSSPDELKKRYKALVRQYHPDNPYTGNTDKFKEIHHAYKMLTDPSYSEKNHDNMAVQSIVIKTSITIEQAVFGLTIIHNLTKINKTFQDSENQAIEQVVKHNVIEIVEKIDKKKSLDFPKTFIKKNINLGDKVTDVHMVYSLQEHSIYKVTEDGFLLIDIELNAIDAMKGVKIEIPTLFGLRTLRVPPGSVPGDILKIKKHGHLQPLLVRVTNIKYPRKAQMKDNPDYSSFGIDWQAEEEIDQREQEEQEELDKLFEKLNN